MGPQLTMETLMPFAVFGMFAALAWWLLEWVATGRSRAAARLDELRNPLIRRGNQQMLKKQDAMSKMLEAATPALARPLQPKSDEELSRLRVRLANAGFRGETAGSVFLGLKFAGLLAGLFFFGGGSLAYWGATRNSLISAVLGGGFLFYLPDLTIYFLAKQRQQAIFLALPDALDLMVVCVEAGLGLDQAMRRVAEEMKNTYRVLCEEFSLANLQLQMGRPRAEVLHELGVRTGVSDVKSLAATLIQADKFGSSVAQALRVQSESMRTRRSQLAEEKAAKTAVKLIFPLVLFIFPGIFVVLVGPAAVKMVHELFPKMGG